MSLFSIESLPEELFLQILDLLPPLCLFQSCVLVSKQWNALVGRVFLPHGRPGIVVNIGISNHNLRKRLVEGNKAERRYDGFQYFIQPADACSVIDGRKVVANLQLMVDDVVEVSNVNIAGLSNNIAEEGHFVVCGVSSVRLEFWPPWRDPEDLAIWLEKTPFTGSKKIWTEQSLLHQMTLSGKRWSFPGIKDLDVKFYTRTLTEASDGVNREASLFPKLQRLSLAFAGECDDTAQVVLAMVLRVTGTAADICTIEELRLGINGPLQNVLQAMARTSASLPRLKKMVSASDRLNWNPPQSVAFGSALTGFAVGTNRLKALQISFESLPYNPATVFPPFSTTLASSFPLLEELTLIILMKPTKILLKTIFWIAFADFIKQQPARRFWLKFKGADGDHVLEQRDIDRDVKRIVKRFEGEVRKRLMVQSGPKRVLKCGFWYPEGI